MNHIYALLYRVLTLLARFERRTRSPHALPHTLSQVLLTHHEKVLKLIEVHCESSLFEIYLVCGVGRARRIVPWFQLPPGFTLLRSVDPASSGPNPPLLK
jgi:hypothetical protein